METAIRKLDRARNREREAILSDLQLYRTLSTVGTTASVFAHEAASPLSRIDRLANAIERRGKKALGDAYPDELGSQVGLLRRAAQALRSFVNLPLTLLQREKRRIRIIDVHQAIEAVLELFSPFLADADVTVKTEYVDTSPRVRGRVASLEAILANLLTNAIGAFQRADSMGEGREIQIRTTESGDQLLISVRDNGPGIRDITKEDIWSPGQTTKPGGTGIGLTIVRDEAADLGGRAYLVPDSDDQGADFVIEVPLHGASRCASPSLMTELTNYWPSKASSRKLAIRRFRERRHFLLWIILSGGSPIRMSKHSFAISVSPLPTTPRFRS